MHPTRYEGSSLVTLEAMAHRRPVVATRAGGLPDKVRPGVNGWLVTPDDAERPGAPLSKTRCRDPARLAAMGARSRDDRRTRVRVERAGGPVPGSLPGPDRPARHWIFRIVIVDCPGAFTTFSISVDAKIFVQPAYSPGCSAGFSM